MTFTSPEMKARATRDYVEVTLADGSHGRITPRDLKSTWPKPPRP